MALVSYTGQVFSADLMVVDGNNFKRVSPRVAIFTAPAKLAGPNQVMAIRWCHGGQLGRQFAAGGCAVFLQAQSG